MLIEWLTPVDAGLMRMLGEAADTVQRIACITVPCSVSVTLTDDAAIREINRAHRDVDSATDVLSFPQVAYKPGEKLHDSLPVLRQQYDVQTGAYELGDIVISLPRVQEQAAMYGHSFEREASYMMVHAVLHLMGYDHMEPEDKEDMRGMEEKALNEMGLHRFNSDDQEDAGLIALAYEAMEHAYVPYSHFRVGAALLGADGQIYQGCNIENASYGLSICAERSALFSAVYKGARTFTKIAVASDNAAPWPCGACRQVLSEFAPDIQVIAVWGKENVERMSLAMLLPNQFGPAALKGKE